MRPASRSSGRGSRSRRSRCPSSGRADIGSRKRARSSWLGASPSAASRSASSRVCFSRPPPTPPMAFASTQSTRARIDPGFPPAVPGVVHEPEPEDEREPHSGPDRHNGDAGQSKQDGDLARALPLQRREVEDPGHHSAAEDEERSADMEEQQPVVGVHGHYPKKPSGRTSSPPAPSHRDDRRGELHARPGRGPRSSSPARSPTLSAPKPASSTSTTTGRTSSFSGPRTERASRR